MLAMERDVDCRERDVDCEGSCSLWREMLTVERNDHCERDVDCGEGCGLWRDVDCREGDVDTVFTV